MAEFYNGSELDFTKARAYFTKAALEDRIKSRQDRGYDVSEELAALESLDD